MKTLVVQLHMQISIDIYIFSMWPTFVGNSYTSHDIVVVAPLNPCLVVYICPLYLQTAGNQTKLIQPFNLSVKTKVAEALTWL